MPIFMPSSPGFVRSKFGLEANTQTFRSPITKTPQRLVLSGAVWMGTYTLPRMSRNDFANWQAFLLELEGAANTFYGFDPDAKEPRGPATGDPQVNGGSQTGSSLTIDGATANIIGWLRPGDYFAVGGEMKMVTAPVNTDGSGNATITFKPALRNSPTDNAPLTVTNATCTMAMLDDSQSVWNTGVRLGIYDELSFSAMEVFS